MNILFLTLSNIENLNNRGLYTDLISELSKQNHNIYVVTPRERRTNLESELSRSGNVNLLKVKVGNVTKNSNLIEKGISTILLESQYLKAIREYFSDICFDLILYSTPPITFNKVIKHFRKHHGAESYLMLKDIFPQNAVDLGFMKKQSIIWRYFRRREKELYAISDYIGCMSEGNREYILSHNNDINISEEHVEVFPNSIKISDLNNDRFNRISILQKHGLPEDKVLFLYGGNLGKPQGVDFLLEVIDNFEDINNGYLIIVGSGTEYTKINNYVEKQKNKNTKLLKFLSKEEFDNLLKSVDVGLVFLDRRFTIPNFPSRITSYMDNCVPILAATDTITDLKEMIIDTNCGLWSPSGKIDEFLSNVKFMIAQPEQRVQMGLNGRKHLEEYFNIEKNVNIILKHFEKEKINV